MRDNAARWWARDTGQSEISTPPVCNFLGRYVAALLAACRTAFLTASLTAPLAAPLAASSAASLAFVLSAGPALGTGGNAPPRLALLVANSGYSQLGELPNPANDATLIGDTLRGLGFDISRHDDLTARGMQRAFRDFALEVDNAGPDVIALVFYAGHGVQVDGANYLLPVDARIRREADLRAEGVRAADLLAYLDTGRRSPTIIILDACRNNPFPTGIRGSRGLAEMEAPGGSIIAFSTSPGRVALDGDGNHSPYARALADALRQPGQTIEGVFRRTRTAVWRETDGAQRPWENTSLFRRVVLAPGAGPDREPRLKSGRKPAQSGPVAALPRDAGPLDTAPVIVRRGGRLAACGGQSAGYQLRAFWMGSSGLPSDRIIGRLPGQSRDATLSVGRTIELAPGCRYKLVRTGSDGRAFAVFERQR